MITIYWYTAGYGVRVVQGAHEQRSATDGIWNDKVRSKDAQPEFVAQKFNSVQDALAKLKPSNRAVPLLRRMING